MKDGKKTYENQNPPFTYITLHITVPVKIKLTSLIRSQQKFSTEY